MDHYNSWDAFCSRVFDECGNSGKHLRMLYGAGGMALLLIIVSMLGFSPFLFLTWLLGFLITPLGMVVAAVLGALAIPVLRSIFSERKKLEPILKRLTEAKGDYDKIITTRADTEDPERRQLIDSLHEWVMARGPRPSV